MVLHFGANPSTEQFQCIAEQGPIRKGTRWPARPKPACRAGVYIRATTHSYVRRAGRSWKWCGRSGQWCQSCADVHAPLTLARSRCRPLAGANFMPRWAESVRPQAPGARFDARSPHGLDRSSVARLHNQEADSVRPPPSGCLPACHPPASVATCAPPTARLPVSSAARSSDRSSAM